MSAAFSFGLLPAVFRGHSAAFLRPITAKESHVFPEVERPHEGQTKPGSASKGVRLHKNSAVAESTTKTPLGSAQRHTEAPPRLTLEDYFAASTELVTIKDGGPPRWFSPLECGARTNDSPLLLFLPGNYNFLFLFPCSAMLILLFFVCLFFYLVVWLELIFLGQFHEELLCICY